MKIRRQKLGFPRDPSRAYLPHFKPPPPRLYFTRTEPKVLFSPNSVKAWVGPSAPGFVNVKTVAFRENQVPPLRKQKEAHPCAFLASLLIALNYC